MAKRLVDLNRDTLLLLSPDMRESVPQDDMVHFVIEAAAIRCARAVLGALIVLSQPARADVPLPPRILEPVTPAEAWNVIGLVSANIQRLLKENRPEEIAEQASLCSPALRLLAQSAPADPEIRRQVDEQTARAFRSVNAIARGGMDRNQPQAAAAFAELRAALQELERHFDPGIATAEIYACIAHPDQLSRETGALCGTCGAAMRARRIPYSFVYASPQAPTLALAARPAGDLRPGKKAKVLAQLSALDGRPVPESDLLVTHTQRIHFFVTDPGLAGCHFVTSESTGQPGEYSFEFTPAGDGPHRVWAEVVPVDTALPEHPHADIGGAVAPGEAQPPAGGRAAVVEALRFQLSFDDTRRAPPQAGSTQGMRLSVSDAGGGPVERLEPVMEAFAHVVGFCADQSAFVRFHPLGGDILNAQARGGPALAFKFHPPKPGAMRLFCLVQVDGRRIVAPFNVTIAE